MDKKQWEEMQRWFDDELAIMEGNKPDPWRRVELLFGLVMFILSIVALAEGVGV